MAVKLRLRREGAKKQPHYRVVVADARSPRDGRFIEIIGEYHPTENPSRVVINEERALHWLSNGAQPTSPVKTLLRITGIWEQFKPGDEPKRDRSSREAEKAAKDAKKKKADEPETPAKAEAEPAAEAEEPEAEIASDDAEAASEPAAEAEEPVAEVEEPAAEADEPAAEAEEPPAEPEEPAAEAASDAEVDEAEVKNAGESQDTTDETDEEEQA